MRYFYHQAVGPPPTHHHRHPAQSILLVAASRWRGKSLNLLLFTEASQFQPFNLSLLFIPLNSSRLN